MKELVLILMTVATGDRAADYHATFWRLGPYPAQLCKEKAVRFNLRQKDREGTKSVYYCVPPDVKR